MPKRAVLVIAQKDFRDEELQAVKNVLTARKVDVSVAAKTRFKAVGRLGTEVKPNLALAEIEAKDFDALVFVGGVGCRQYMQDEIALKLVNEFKNAKKIIAGSCLAPSILANAGALISKQATGFPTEENHLKDRGAEYTGMPSQVDGLVVTSKEPTDAKKLGEHIAYLLEG